MSLDEMGEMGRDITERLGLMLEGREGVSNSFVDCFGGR
jgi:hypothetical protein